MYFVALIRVGGHDDHILLYFAGVCCLVHVSEWVLDFELEINTIFFFVALPGFEKVEFLRAGRSRVRVVISLF